MSLIMLQLYSYIVNIVFVSLIVIYFLVYPGDIEQTEQQNINDTDYSRPLYLHDLQRSSRLMSNSVDSVESYSMVFHVCYHFYIIDYCNKTVIC